MGQRHAVNSALAGVTIGSAGLAVYVLKQGFDGFLIAGQAFVLIAIPLLMRRPIGAKEG